MLFPPAGRGGFVRAVLAVILLAVGSAGAGGLNPVLGPREDAALEDALNVLNMTRTDLGFEKDVGKPKLVLERSRRILDEPMLLPALADSILATVRTDGLSKFWSLARDLLETPPRVNPPDGKTAPGRAGAGWAELDPLLVECIDGFLSGARNANELLSAAFAGLSEEDERFLAAGFLAGLFNAGDYPEVRADLASAGVTAEDVDRAIREGLEIDPEPSATNTLALIAKIDLDALLAAGEVFQRAVYELADRCAGVTSWPARVTALDSALGRIVIGTTTSDVFATSALLILDPGLDDTYVGGAASANGLLGRPLAAVVDLGGDDTYAGDQVAGAGSALFGVCVMLDARGDDRYEAKYMGDAAALYGAAWIEDRAGDDTHTARGFAQAAAFVGFGFLHDTKGDDAFHVGYCGQAYAGVLGAAILVNVKGDDRYCAGGIEKDHERLDDHFISLSQGFATGMRPVAGGGVAALVDLVGDDRYEADVFGQGVGYWYSVGLLLDVAGNDSYQVTEYGQGAGIHLSAGLLADGAGWDDYKGRILAQGCAHDYAVGMLIDQGGNDSYEASRHSQGRGMNNGLGILIDTAGTDGYEAANPDECQGIGNAGDKREYGCLGLLLDLGGPDTYSCGAEDGARLIRPDYGIVYDVKDSLIESPSGDMPPPPGMDFNRSICDPYGHVQPPPTDLPPAAELDPKSATYDELVFHVQRYGNTQKKRDDKAAAREELFARAPESFRELMMRVHIENVMIGVLVQNMVEELDPTNTAPILVEFLDSDRAQTRKVAAYFLGFHDTPQYADKVGPLLADDEAAGAAMRTLGKWRVRESAPRIVPFLGHPREVRRIAAANALREIGDPMAIPALLPLLGDRFFTVRETASRALAAMGEPAETALLEALPDALAPAKRQIIRTLGAMKSRRAEPALRGLLDDPDPMVREDAARALSAPKS